MTINRYGLIFTKGGTCTGIRIRFSLEIDQPEGKTNWFLLPTYLTVISGIVQIRGKVKIVDNQVYLGRLAISNIQKMENSTIKNLFKVENFEACFPGLNIYVRKLSKIQIRLDQITPSQILPPEYTIFKNRQLYTVRFQL